jgi:hypothetical protein
MESPTNLSRTRIIRVLENRIYIAPNYYFTLEETNLPTNYFSFKSTDNFFWEILITHYEKLSKILLIKIINYHPANVKPYYIQNVKSTSDISLLHFEKMEWKHLEPFLSMYRKTDLLQLLSEEK